MSAKKCAWVLLLLVWSAGCAAPLDSYSDTGTGAKSSAGELPFTDRGNAALNDTPSITGEASTPKKAPDDILFSDQIRSSTGTGSTTLLQPTDDTPFLGLVPRSKTRPKVKGIYVSGWSAGTRKIEPLIDLVDRTELNAMVIDVKNDSGQITYDSKLPAADETGSDSRKMIPDLKQLLSELKQEQIYTIGRVVVFKDPFMASRKPEWAMRSKNGGIWRDRKGTAWVDPYLADVWRYTLDIAREAAGLGFDEIQFDYVRFPDNGDQVDREVAFRNPNGWSKQEAIRRFLQQAKGELVPLGVWVSADVFGLTPSVSTDMGIGQTWEEIAQEVDVISPMIYPSHYRSGTFGIAHPDLEPYAIVQKAVSDSLGRNRRLLEANKQPAAVRPWFQDFTATWVKPHRTYGNAEVRAQIEAAKSLGVDEYLLWNAASTYTFR